LINLNRYYKTTLPDQTEFSAQVIPILIFFSGKRKLTKLWELILLSSKWEIVRLWYLSFGCWKKLWDQIKAIPNAKPV